MRPSEEECPLTGKSAAHVIVNQKVEQRVEGTIRKVGRGREHPRRAYKACTARRVGGEVGPRRPGGKVSVNYI